MDCGFHQDGHWFRLRAAAIILDGERVLMARNDLDPYHYAIGGGVHHGETTEAAVRREVLEETGLDLQIQRPLFIHENFFTLSNGDPAHELAFYFLMHFDPTRHRPRNTTSTSMDGAREWCEWVPLKDYGRLRPAYPTFLAELLSNLPRTLRIIRTTEPSGSGPTL